MDECRAHGAPTTGASCAQCKLQLILRNRIGNKKPYILLHVNEPLKYQITDHVRSHVVPFVVPSAAEAKGQSFPYFAKKLRCSQVDKLAVELFTPFAYPNREAKVEQRQPILGDYASVRGNRRSLQQSSSCVFEFF